MIVSSKKWSKKWSIFGFIVVLFISGCTLTNAKTDGNLGDEKSIFEEKEEAIELEGSEIPLPGAEGVTLFGIEENVAELANVWANALKTRDGKPRYDMMSKAAKEKFKQEQIIRSGENWNYNIGGSSPWVTGFQIETDGMTAIITYTTETSEPATYQTQEIIRFTRENGKLVVDDYETIFEDKLIEKTKFDN